MAENEPLEQMTGISQGQGDPRSKRESSGALGPLGDVAEVVGDVIIDGAFDLVSGAVRGVQEGGEVVLNAAVSVGGTAIEVIAQVGGAVVENAPAVAEAAVDAVGTVIGDLLDS
jgi:hypothetical protein